MKLPPLFLAPDAVWSRMAQRAYFLAPENAREHLVCRALVEAWIEGRSARAVSGPETPTWLTFEDRCLAQGWTEADGRASRPLTRALAEAWFEGRQGHPGDGVP